MPVRLGIRSVQPVSTRLRTNLIWATTGLLIAATLTVAGYLQASSHHAPRLQQHGGGASGHSNIQRGSSGRDPRQPGVSGGDIAAVRVAPVQTLVRPVPPPGTPATQESTDATTATTQP